MCALDRVSSFQERAPLAFLLVLFEAGVIGIVPERLCKLGFLLEKIAADVF